MITGQSFDTMKYLRLSAMIKEYRRQYELESAMDGLTFDERLDMLLEAERLHRENNKQQRLMKSANLRDKSACLKNIDYDPIRKLDRAQIARLSSCNWIKKRHHLFITGKCGTGKTFLSSAFGVAAVNLGYHVLSYKMTRLLSDLAAAENMGTIGKFLTALKKPSLLIIDDFGLAPINSRRCMDLYDIIDERQDIGSIIATAQLPVSEWHAVFEDATYADAILDRIVHRSERIEVHGPSRRRNELAAVESS